MWHQLIKRSTDRRHFVFDCFLHLGQSIMQFITKQFTNRTDSSVSKVVTVINMPLTIFDFNQIFNRVDNILCRHHCHILRNIQSQLMIHLHSTNFSEVISLWVKKELSQKSFCCFRCDWLTWSHHFVNTDRCKYILIFDLFCLLEQSQALLISYKCLDDRTICIFSKVVSNFDRFYALLYHFFEFAFIKRRDNIIKHFTALLVNHCLGKISLH